MVFFRFLVGGVINTAITYAFYLLILSVLDYKFAYAASWILGLLIVSFFYPHKVFLSNQKGFAKHYIVACSYLLVFFIGGFLLEYFVEGLLFPAQVAMIIITIFNASLNFLLMRALLRKLSYSND